MEIIGVTADEKSAEIRVRVTGTNSDGEYTFSISAVKQKYGTRVGIKVTQDDRWQFVDVEI